MLKLTKRTEYALIALVHLADREAGGSFGASRGGFVSAREIVELYPVPKRLVAEVLKDLARHHILESHRGASGGYALAKPASEISLGEVIAALEGPPTLAGTGGLCPIKNPTARVRLGIWDLMQRTSLSDLLRAGRPTTRAAAALAGSVPIDVPTAIPTAASL